MPHTNRITVTNMRMLLLVYFFIGTSYTEPFISCHDCCDVNESTLIDTSKCSEILGLPLALCPYIPGLCPENKLDNQNVGVLQQ